ncbi:MAG TPA: helix-turn-helix domain-containing protein, partial [Ktedonobacteraceae bacterium]|nr:helix-turn-helix domain-containing protein [Ktedonobacteraceae bacterium]
GNVRELENMLERVTYLMPKSTITVDDLPVDLQQTQESVEVSRLQTVDRTTQDAYNQHSKHQLAHVIDKNAALKEQSMNAEMQAIMQAWDASNGRVIRAAALLGISRTTMWRKMVKYGLAEGKVKR